jgi:cysteine synthase B
MNHPGLLARQLLLLEGGLPSTPPFGPPNRPAPLFPPGDGLPAQGAATLSLLPETIEENFPPDWNLCRSGTYHGQARFVEERTTRERGTEKISMAERNTLLDQVGNTPIILLKRSSPNPEVRIWAKLELQNPTGSLKDRIALYMIEQAEREGLLAPEMTIVEATSGNTGIALGMVAAVKGYKLKLFMLENKTLERRKLLKYWGADLVLTTKDDPDSHIYGAQELIGTSPTNYYYINQNENEDNVEAHRQTTAVEIVQELDGKVDAFVAGFGTGGMLMGVGQHMRDQGLSTRIVAVEPGGDPRAKIDGLKHSSESYQPTIYDRSLIDETIEVGEDEAYSTTRQIASLEGVIAGLSSGACLWAAQELAKQMDRGDIVVIFGDRAERYFSTRLFDSA